VRYRFIGEHAHEFEVGDARVQVGPGDFIELDEIPEDMESVMIEAPEEEAAKQTPTAKKEVT
jgi:hypothetical protein